MKLPSNVWKITGTRPGPRFVILGGVHGDELTGVEIVTILRDKFGLSTTTFETTSNLIAGELILALGNPLAIELNQRAAGDGPDLNRSFSHTELTQQPAPGDRYDLTRARELAPFLANCDFMLDVHATSNPSEPFVCIQPYSPNTQPFLSQIPIRYIFSDPHCIYLGDEGITELCTTDAYVNQHGGIGVCFETGYQKDLTKIPEVLSIIGSLFLHTRLVPDESALTHMGLSKNERPTPTQTIFQVIYSQLAQYPNFTYSDSMDSGWQRVTKGDLVGTYDNGEKVYIPHDGMYVFPKKVSNIKIGKNLFTIAQEL